MTTQQIAQLLIEGNPASPTPAFTVRCTGPWTVQGICPLEQQLETQTWPAATDLIIDTSDISALDTTGAWLLHRTVRALEQLGKNIRIDGLRPEFSILLKLIATRTAHAKYLPPPKAGLLDSIGRRAWNRMGYLFNMLAFAGEAAVVLLRSLMRPRRLRWRPILHNLQTSGVEAMPITGLLSFLMGVVIAYQGADQLQRFGANIFIVDLVGLAMLRELSPLLTAIIIAGRSGSAYAAQIGTMKITEEIDALRTVGVGPHELLVLPKMLALIIALPLLTVFADVAGIFGGMVMASSRLDVSFDVFLNRLGDAVSLSSFLVGIVKAPVFAAIIALTGCYQGFQVSDSTDSVGRQTTVSVVQSIFVVILADALFSIVFNWLNL
ncbi:Intermembrane phospholipid transport system permease protein MlaE [Gallionellaceae bacterium]|nr:Intermembrane phospholipid transport system permease protein MlaE [Gallionellaceae bacterium]